MAIAVIDKPVLKVHAFIVYQKVDYYTELKCSVESSDPAPTSVYWSYRTEGSSKRYVHGAMCGVCFYLYK